MSRPTQGYANSLGACRYGAVTLSGGPFQALPVRSELVSRGPTTPTAPRRPRFRLIPFRSPLLWESMFLSLPAGTKMFQFPAFAPLRCRTFSAAGSPIRTPADQLPFADPRGFSQLATSFIAGGSQGIPRTPLSYCPVNLVAASSHDSAA